ncbi:O-antigen ligase family protein [Parabacteroides goldsteinii]
MQKIIYGSNSVLIIISIYLTDSRSAILSISICTICILLFTSLGILFLYNLINHRKDSVDGRILIYKITTKMIFDKPILGFGYNTFYSVYPDYQASYFSTNPDSKYKIFADNTKYGFNEVLQIGAEYGIIGIILTLIFIIYLLTIKTNENKFIISPLKYSVLSILIVSLSSYPLRRVETLLTITILIGILASFEKRILFSFNKIQCKLLIILFSFFSFSFIGSIINRKNPYTIWQNTKNTSISDKEKMTIYNSIKDKLKYDTQFLYNYAVILSKCQKNEESNIYLDKILTHMNTSSIWILKGNNYKNINNLHEAIKCYTYASKIVPNRIFPLYQLMLIYKEYNKQNQMIKIAKHIKEFNVKIPSYTTQKIKEEANEIISIYN